MLVVLRFIVGLGRGAGLPVASTLVSEFAPRTIRGRVVVALEAFWAAGGLLAALIGYVVVPAGDDGWRWALAVGLVPAAYALVIRFGLPESLRYRESRGRHDEAEHIVRHYEASADVEPPAQRAPDAPAPAVTPVEGETRESIWSPRLRARTAALWIVWFGIKIGRASCRERG